ncbi:MAG: hypothetical protein ACJ79K_17955 [Gemmatimonadaceae bacterium]
MKFSHHWSRRAMRATLTHAVFAVALAASLPLTASAQFRGAPKASGTCGNSPLYRVPVYATLEMVDRDHPLPPPDLQNLLQAVVDRADTLLGGRPGVLPRGEPAITGNAIGRDIIVSWHRDGKLTSTIDGETDPRFNASNLAGARLLARALDSAQKAGDIFLTWPAAATGDSIGFTIELRAAEVDGSGKVYPVHASLGIPAMSLDVSTEEPVKILKAPRIDYPSYSQAGHATGVVLMQYVVDTSGRADMSTVKDLWPKNKPRPVDETSEFYREFRRAAERAIADARYIPASIGGCPVRQMVQQPFTFALR